MRSAALLTASWRHQQELSVSGLREVEQLLTKYSGFPIILISAKWRLEKVLVGLFLEPLRGTTSRLCLY